jgi:polyhydroxybutyrate depolymerase
MPCATSPTTATAARGHRLRWSICGLLAAVTALTGCSPGSHPAAGAAAAESSAAQASVLDHPVWTTGCGHAVADHTITRTLQVNGLARHYLAHVPAHASADTPMPVILYFHGGGRAPANWLHTVDTQSGFSQLADQHHFIAVYPLGSTRPTDGRVGWNTGAAPLVTYDPRADDVLFVSRLLDDLQDTLCVDNTRIYATGFSSGASMTDVLSCRLAGRIAAFAPVEGAYFPMPGGCHPTRPVSMISFAGTGDDKVPYDTATTSGYGAGMEPVTQWLSQRAAIDGCAPAPLTFFTQDDVIGQRWSGCQAGADLIHYRIEHGQHAWPGGMNWQGAPAGTSTINATALILAFFTAHPRS